MFSEEDRGGFIGRMAIGYWSHQRLNDQAYRLVFGVPILQLGRIEGVSRYNSIVALGLVGDKPAQDLKAERWGHTKCRKLNGPNPCGNILFVRRHWFLSLWCRYPDQFLATNGFAADEAGIAGFPEISLPSLLLGFLWIAVAGADISLNVDIAGISGKSWPACRSSCVLLILIEFLGQGPSPCLSGGGSSPL
jgi:hypothetical protein